MTTPEVLVAIAGILLTIASGYMALRLKPIERDVDGLGARITALHDDAKEARQDFERRIADIERSYISRADLTAAIRDLRESNDRGVERIEKGFLALGAKVDHLAERVGKVESAS